MTDDDEIARAVRVAPDGAVTFAGRTPAELLAELDRPLSTSCSHAGRRCAGLVHRGRRQGAWTFERDGAPAIEVRFVDDVPVAAPPDFRDDEWPRCHSPEAHAIEVAALTHVLREYRRPEDAPRVVAEMRTNGYQLLRILAAFRHALNISLRAARQLTDI